MAIITKPFVCCCGDGYLLHLGITAPKLNLTVYGKYGHMKHVAINVNCLGAGRKVNGWFPFFQLLRHAIGALVLSSAEAGARSRDCSGPTLTTWENNKNSNNQQQQKKTPFVIT